MANVKYRPDKGGLRALGRSAAIQGVALDGARRLAAEARADDPSGGYEAIPSAVVAGWDNEMRAGAAVLETERGRGPQRRTLARVAEGGGT